jgi:hypothetical protein
MKHPLLLLALLTLFSACGSTRAGETGERRDGGLLIRGTELNGPLLQAMQGRVRNMTITAESGRCPRITFRGQRSAIQQGDPSVYVDGSPMRDTCILQQIQSSDVEWIRIYTGGASRPAGMDHNPFGTIVVQRVRR